MFINTYNIFICKKNKIHYNQKHSLQYPAIAFFYILDNSLQYPAVACRSLFYIYYKNT